MTEIFTKRGRGRPAAFDYDTALGHAMYTFWLYGYEGASMNALTKAMDMNKTSIYSAFGSKEQLFQKALNRYANGPAKFVADSLNESTAYEVVNKLLSTAAINLTSQNNPCGCLIIQGALTCSSEAKHIHDLLSSYRNSFEKNLVARLERAKKENDISNQADTNALAKLVTTVHQGMSVQASSGASKDELLTIAKMVAEKFK